MVTNNAAAALVFPIAVSISELSGYDARPFVIAICIAAACSFISPIGYQTNLMIYGPGGYAFKDFFKVGFPLTMIYMVVTVTILCLFYF